MSGVEVTHPDKGTELFLYDDNEAGRAVYRSAGGAEASRPFMVEWSTGRS